MNDPNNKTSNVTIGVNIIVNEKTIINKIIFKILSSMVIKK